MNASDGLIPEDFVQNGDERLVVLNRIARSVTEPMRGKHPAHVFCDPGKPVRRMLNGARLRARRAVALPSVRVHELKHTFDGRLRAAGMGFEDRQGLLGHGSGRITTYYSAAELSRMIESANTVCERGTR